MKNAATIILTIAGYMEVLGIRQIQKRKTMDDQNLVKTREYSEEELKHPPWRTIRIENEPELELANEDLSFEDTMPVYISLPRIMWKYFYGIKVANDLELSSVVSAFIGTFFEHEILPKLVAKKGLDEEVLTELMEIIGSLLERVKESNKDKKGED